jgi:hypothetical protein
LVVLLTYTITSPINLLGTATNGRLFEAFSIFRENHKKCSSHQNVIPFIGSNLVLDILKAVLCTEGVSRSGVGPRMQALGSSSYSDDYFFVAHLGDLLDYLVEVYFLEPIFSLFQAQIYHIIA